MTPVTCLQVKRSAAPVIGLVPTSPTIDEVGTFVIPAFERITKPPADLRSTGAGPGPSANALPASVSSAIPAKYVAVFISNSVPRRRHPGMYCNAHRSQFIFTPARTNIGETKGLGFLLKQRTQQQIPAHPTPRLRMKASSGACALSGKLRPQARLVYKALRRPANRLKRRTITAITSRR